ncbi:hypothetical protein H6G41_00200 [Tolypothrix sp. FACHB-123]|uniref:hypothetical protein n=1 Tax=Tolypothrix sp. FACHB-123 TaxID=2692868 RepID=UPI0016878184|nr:hypothetical protein [Tolypothrix sp. FACHB-123]MBD2353055.1 hypothetical protein [Tolypothrix sp. FACHB-123]
MLKEASTHLIIPEPSDELIANEPWTIEVYADGLMDEIFADIDNVLDATGDFSHQTVNVEYVPLQTVKMPQIVLPDELQQAVEGVSQMREKPVSKVVVDTPAKKAVIRKLKKTKSPFGTLLIIGSTIIGVAIAGIIYLFNSRLLTFATSKPITSAYIQGQQPQLPTKVDVQAELVDYMLGALSIIEQQQSKNNQSYATPGNNNIGETPKVAALPVVSTQKNLLLPTPLAANNVPPAPRLTKNIVERIYIPVYQAPAPMRNVPSLLPQIPKTKSPVAAVPTISRPGAVKNALNAVRKPAKPVSVNMFAAAVRTDLKPVSVRTAPVAVGQTSNLLPTLPVVPFRAAPAQASTATASVSTVSLQQAVSTTSQPLPTHILEGIMELGNKSAALFKIDGSTQRFAIGESIGSSGWTLVDVSNGEAIVRRNGEVRSIYTGQKL